MSRDSDSLDLPGDGSREETVFAKQNEHSILSEQDLRWLASGTLSHVLRSTGKHSSEDQLEIAGRLWNRLLLTMRNSEINDRHMTAACNAISVFLDSACNSSNDAIVALGISPTAWNVCVDLVANLYETAKVKAMRQVLVTLCNLLQTFSSRAETQGLKMTMLQRALDVVYTSKPRQQLKASMNIIELLLRKVLDIDEFVTSLEKCRLQNVQQWTRKFARNNMPIANVSQMALVQTAHAPRHDQSIAILDFVYTLWHDIIFTDLQPSVVSLFDTVAQKVQGSALSSSLFALSKDCYPPWALLLNHLLSVFPNSTNAFSVHLFPRLIKLDPQGYRMFALHNPEQNSGLVSDSATNLSTRLAAVQVGRQSSLFPAEESKVIFNAGQRVSIVGLLSHLNGDVRIRAFSFLVNSSTTTEPLEAEVLGAILENLCYLYGDADAGNRGDILSITRRLILRIRASSRVKRPEASDLEQRYRKFLLEFLKFFENELGPTCSYQRHICALKTLDILIAAGLDPKVEVVNKARLGNDQGVFDFHISLHSKSMLFSLLNLLMDPFQEIRTSVAAVLEAYLGFIISDAEWKHFVTSRSIMETTTQKSPIDEITLRAERLAMSTHRADHADGLGRLYCLRYASSMASGQDRQFFEKLLSRVELVFPEPGRSLDLKTPVPDLPLHGLLVGIRYCVAAADSLQYCQNVSNVASQDSSNIVDRMLTICEVIWTRVRGRLCVDAPESEDDDNEESGANAAGGPKDVLSYSWRALRDASLLLSSIISKASSRNGGGMNYTQSVKAGELCLQQLSELRHRGAFSTVSQTFAVCCSMCVKSSVNGVPQLLDKWYTLAVQTIDEQAFRLTRRSAGLPALLAAIMGPASVQVFNEFMQSFLARAVDLNGLTSTPGPIDADIPLSQVHILNCLREIITNSSFRERTEEWIMPALKAATACLTCNIWAIRNCGLMLFRACAQRLCRPRDKGLRYVQRSEVMQSAQFIPLARWPDTLTVAIDLLEEEISGETLQSKMGATVLAGNEILIGDQAGNGTSLAPERVFAGLDLLGRIQHNTGSWKEAMPYIVANLGNKVWLIRDHAARIFAANVDPYQSVAGIGELLDRFDICNENGRHGRLLAFAYILQTLWTLPNLELTKEVFDSLAMSCARVRHHIVEHDTSPAVRSKFLDITNDIWRAGISAQMPMEELPEWRSQCDIWFGEGNSAEERHIKHVMNRRLRQSLCVLDARVTASSLRKEHSSSLHPCSSKLELSLALEDDINVALASLKELSKPGNQDVVLSHEVYELLIVCLEQSTDDHVRVVAMEGVTMVLEKTGRGASDLGLERLQASSNIVGGRKLWNARLRLKCALYRLAFPAKQHLYDGTCPQTCDLCSYLAACKTALEDDTDFPTRLNALHSLRSLMPIAFSQHAESLSHRKHMLQAGLVMNDALNDDDEDIRDLASSLEAESQRLLGSHGETLIPLAAAVRLVDSLVFKCGDMQMFQLRAISKILSEDQILRTSTPSSGEISRIMDQRFNEVTQTSDDLFEEEKQNLYIDEVRNSHIWTRALLKLDPSKVNHQARESATSWATSGLARATKLVEREAEGYPLGLLWKPEVVILITGIICCAELAISWSCVTAAAAAVTPAASEDEDKEEPAQHLQPLRQQLIDFQDLLQRMSAHGPVMRNVADVIHAVS